MDFALTKEQEMIRKFAREFSEKEVKPIAAEIDENHRFPRETIIKMAKQDMMGITIPKEYGGAGGDVLSEIIVIEELSKGCASTGDILATHTSLGTGPILQFGTKAQKDKYLPLLATGKYLGAFALTEPNAGSDASGQQTVAVLDGDNYVINGSKVFITSGGEADVYIVFAMTDKSKGLRGISSFIVEKTFPGFKIGKKENKLGIRGSSTAEIIFENCIVPKVNLLGQEGKGFAIAMKTLDSGRIGIGAQAIGIAQGALDESLKYVKERKQFGKRIADFQGMQWILAEMEVQVQAARLLTYNAAQRRQDKLSYTKEAAMAKLFASEAAMKVTTLAVQLHGGYGYTMDYPVERMMRDAKITEIYEGTSQVQKMVISANMLK